MDHTNNFYDENGKLCVICSDKLLFSGTDLQLKIIELVKNNPRFKDYIKDLNWRYNNFYIVTSNRKNYLGYHTNNEKEIGFFKNCHKISLSQLLCILEGKNTKIKDVREIELYTKISLDRIKIDNFDINRYS